MYKSLGCSEKTILDNNIKKIISLKLLNHTTNANLKEFISLKLSLKDSITTYLKYSILDVNSLDDIMLNLLVRSNVISKSTLNLINKLAKHTIMKEEFEEYGVDNVYDYIDLFMEFLNFMDSEYNIRCDLQHISTLQSTKKEDVDTSSIRYKLFEKYYKDGWEIFSAEIQNKNVEVDESYIIDYYGEDSIVISFLSRFNSIIENLIEKCIPSSWIEGFHCNSLMVTKTHNVYSLQLDDYAYDRIPTKFYVLLIIGGYLLNEHVL